MRRLDVNDAHTARFVVGGTGHERIERYAGRTVELDLSRPRPVDRPLGQPYHRAGRLSDLQQRRQLLQEVIPEKHDALR